MGMFANLLGTFLGSFGIGPKGARATLSASGLTADRAHTLPDKAGTIALLDDVSGARATPTLVATGTTFTVPANTQVLFTLPIELEGTAVLDVVGALVEVN